MAKPADRSSWPQKGANAGRDIFDPSIWEIEAERAVQQLIADQRRRNIERLRRTMDAADDPTDG